MDSEDSQAYHSSEESAGTDTDAENAQSVQEEEDNTGPGDEMEIAEGSSCDDGIEDVPLNKHSPELIKPVFSEESEDTTDYDMDVRIDNVEITGSSEENTEFATDDTTDLQENMDDGLSITETMEVGSKEKETCGEMDKPNPLIDVTVDSINDKHPGVFVESLNNDDSDKSNDNKSGADTDDENDKNSTNVIENKKAKDILDSLPVLERLRSISRPGSLKDKEDNSAISETGEGSDKGSVVRVTRNSKKRQQEQKKAPSAPTKKTSTSSRSVKRIGGGLSTRSTKGKGRRSLVKQKPVKSSNETPTVVTSDKIYFKGQYYRVGDIVSVTNIDDGDVYYAQIRGFLTDEYADKSAVITWLLPTAASPPPNEGFHPATYIIGPEEDIARNMEVFTFVMHAPDDYFYNRRAPYRTQVLHSTGSDYTSIRLGPRLRKTVDNKDVYVGLY